MWENPMLNKYQAISVFADYFTEQWIDNDSLPQSYWNIHGRGEDDRTNNVYESWHSKWNRRTSAIHQHIWKLTCQLMDFHEFQLIEIHMAEQDQLSMKKKSKK